MRYDTMIFDLDGTLTDPKEGITRCVQYALAKMGIDEPDADRLIPYIGPPLAYGFKTFHGIDDARIPDAIAAYRERFVAKGMMENKLYAGIPQLLDALGQRGVRLVLATSKLEPYAVRILEHFALLPHFQFVAGSLHDGSRAEKGAVIAHVMETLALHPASTLMIGDTKFDIIGARENGLDSVAVSYGYGSWPETLAQEPTFVCDTVAELTSTLMAFCA